jgi:aprataxin
MAETPDDVEADAIPASYSSSAAQNQAPSEPAAAASKKRNAFTELMAPKPKVPKSDPQLHKKSQSTGGFAARAGLLEYILHPDRFGPDVVLRVTPNTVLIRDAFPKATIHLLLLPRSAAHYDKHPHEAFEDAEFLTMMKSEAASAATLAAAELKRLMSSRSATLKARNDALDAGVAGDDLPADRDFSDDIRIGVHAHPSMNHLHVHIISRDMHSDRLKHRKHYNSFNTPFFIPLADCPLEDDDKRRETQFQNGNLRKDFLCWRCGKEFGNKFVELKKHLDEEFEEWSRI